MRWEHAMYRHRGLCLSRLAIVGLLSSAGARAGVRGAACFGSFVSLSPFLFASLAARKGERDTKAHAATTPLTCGSCCAAATRPFTLRGGGEMDDADAASNPPADQAAAQPEGERASGPPAAAGEACASSSAAPEVLALPAATGEPTKVTVNGGSVSLEDEMGPLVVNENGSLSRIANWPEMSAIERERTVRILGKRNKLRLENLRAQQPAPEGGENA